LVPKLNPFLPPHTPPLSITPLSTAIQNEDGLPVAPPGESGGNLSGGAAADPGAAGGHAKRPGTGAGVSAGALRASQIDGFSSCVDGRARRAEHRRETPPARRWFAPPASRMSRRCESIYWKTGEGGTTDAGLRDIR